MDQIDFDRRRFLAGGTAAALLTGCAARAPISLAAVQPDIPLLWEKLPTEEYRGKQDDIAFGSASRGWYGNGEGRLFRTDDAGDSWTQVWHRPGTFVRALGFIDEEQGILGNVGVGSFPNVTDRAPLYRTEDGGLSWRPAAIEGPMPEGICAIHIFRQLFIDRGSLGERRMVHAGGRVGGPAHYLRSDDDGRSWRSTDLGALTAAIFDVFFQSSAVGFIAGATARDLSAARGLILRTDDGGDSWREVYRSTRPFETVWKIHFPTASVGFGSVQSYDPDPGVTQRWLVGSSDGGRSWTEMPLVDDAAWRSFGIGFANERLGWVGGNKGGLETRDGGRTWSAVDMGRAVNKIRFVDYGRIRRAYAIGSSVHRLSLS